MAAAIDRTGGPWFFSASQVDTYLQCPRKWAWKYIAGVEVPTGPSAQFGTGVHGILEQFLRDGVPIPFDTLEGQVAALAVPYIPRIEEPDSFECEQHWTLEMPSGNLFQGYIDLAIYPNVVVDYKTTSSPRWAKTTDDLVSRDVAAALYSYATMVKQRVAQVELRWIYMTTKGAKKAWPVDATVLSSDVVPTVKGIDLCASEMRVHLETKADPLSLPPNPDACEAYGGCPHKFRCNLSPVQIMQAHMGGGKIMALSDFIKKAQEKTPVAPTAPATPAEFKPSWAGGQINPPESVPNTTLAQSQATHAAVVAEKEPKEPTPVAAPAAKRTRKAKEPSEDPPAVVPVVPPGTIERTTKPLEVFVDCTPIGEPCVTYGEIFEMARKLISDAKKVPHPSLLAYGEARATLFGAFTEVARELSGLSVTCPGTADVFLEVVSAMGTRIVRGYR